MRLVSRLGSGESVDIDRAWPQRAPALSERAPFNHSAISSSPVRTLCESTPATRHRVIRSAPDQADKCWPDLV